jgi:hypothetical protein
MARSLAHLPLDVQRAVEQYRRARQSPPEDATQRDPLSTEAVAWLREFLSSGEYDRIVDEFTRDDPDLES